MRPSPIHPAFALVGLFLLSPAAAPAQERPPPRIQGVVVDSVTGRVLPRAVVLLEGAAEVFTDGNGRYALEQAPVGEHLLAVVTRDCRIAAVRLRLDDEDPVRLDLEVGLQRLDGAQAALSRARAEGTAMRVTTREEIQRLGERSVPAILRRLAPSMVGPPTGRPGGGVQVRERGVTTITGSRTPLLLLDGVRVSDLHALESLDPNSISKIEVAAGPAGGWAWGLEGVNGVIHIRTHDRDPVEDPYCGAVTRR